MYRDNTDKSRAKRRILEYKPATGKLFSTPKSWFKSIIVKLSKIFSARSRFKSAIQGFLKRAKMCDSNTLNVFVGNEVHLKIKAKQ